jgi:hypothetical protein
MKGMIPMTYAMQILGQCAEELTARPEIDDILTVIARGGDADIERAFTWASVALDQVPSGKLPILYVLEAVFTDEELLEFTGSLPEDSAMRLIQLIARLDLADVMTSLRDRAFQEELLRLSALALGLGFAGEREATTRFLLTTIDSATAALEKQSRDYTTRLNSAKAAVDNKHRPARPYGE